MPRLLQVFCRLATLRWLGVLLCVLAMMLGVASTASALERVHTKTRVGDFELAEQHSDGLLRSATPRTHPGFSPSLSEEAAGSLLDAEGRPDVLSGGVTSNFDFDGIGRPKSLVHDLAGTVYDNIYGYRPNPASQLTKFTASSGNFAPVATPRNETYQVNGLNQYTRVAGVEQAYDDNGNLTSDGESTYAYDQENRLVRATTTSSGALKAELWYDPLGRPYKLQSASATTHFLYDGDELVAEYDAASNTVTQRYVHGAAVDDPVAWFQGSAVTAGNRRHLRANHQGSIVAVADAAGAKLHLPRYDTWGKPLGSHPIRFGYTGQAWIPELGLWHYKARMYSPQLGRFLQTDPVGYEAQLNLYAYVANDPINHTDPSGRLGDGASMDRFLRTQQDHSDPNFIKGQVAGAAAGAVAGGAALGGAIEAGAAALLTRAAASSSALARAAGAGVSAAIAAAKGLAEAPTSPAAAKGEGKIVYRGGSRTPDN